MFPEVFNCQKTQVFPLLKRFATPSLHSPCIYYTLPFLLLFASVRAVEPFSTIVVIAPLLFFSKYFILTFASYKRFRMYFVSRYPT